MAGLLTRILAADPFDDRYYPGVGMVSSTGINVTTEVALRVSAVWRCITLLSQTMASLPLPVYRHTADDGKERAREHPLWDVLNREPNEWQTAYEFREMMMGHLLLRGNFYALIVPGARGAVDQLVPQHPDRVKIELDGNLPVYKIRRRDSTEIKTFLADEVFHVRGFGTDGYRGLSVIELARDTISLGIAYDEYAGGLFKHGAQPPGVLTHPKGLSTTARRNLRRSIRENYGSRANYGRWLILEEGMKWEKIGMTNADAEYLASRKFSVTEIARWFGVPPHKVADLERSTNNNIEHQGIEWVVDGVLNWARRIESAMLRDLVIAPQLYFVEHLLDGLLRGDIKTRYEAYAKAIQWGWMSPNDVRRLENMNPIPGGDVYLRPLNMQPFGGRDGEAAGVSFAHVGTDGKVIPLPLPSSNGHALNGQLQRLATDAATRVVRKEVAAMRKLIEKSGTDADAWQAGVEAFYVDHARFVADTMRIPESDARQWARDQRDEILGDGPMVLERWETDRAPELAKLSVFQEVTAAA